MKKNLGALAVLAAIAITFASCNGCGHGHPPTSSVDSSYIPADSANRMISSYISSLQGNPDELHSLLLNAEALRTYLNSDAGQGASTIKVMFAHTLDYINAGNEGVPCGYGSGKLSVVLAGYDAEGNYVLVPSGTGIDFAHPCPSACPTGQASGDLLPTSEASRKR